MRAFTRFRRTVASLLILSMSVGPTFAGTYAYQVPLKHESEFPTWVPNLQLSSASHDFGTVVLGGSSATTVELTNMGRQPLDVTALKTVVPFAHSSNCPTRLYGGASCAVNLVYQPAVAGSSDAALSVTTTANSASMELQGAAVVPTTTLSLSAAFLSFDASDVGQPAGRRQLVVTNTGNSSATVTGIGVSTGGSDFLQNNNCASALAPGASCAINASFVPTAYGARTGNLNIYEEASGTLYNVSLSGFGNAAVLEATPANVAFGSPVVGTFADRVVTVRNAGNQSIEGLAPALNDAEFKIQSTDCTATLVATATCSLNVRFTAQLAGDKVVTLRVNTSNASSTSVALTGTAIAQAPKVTATPADAAFGDVEVGTTTPAQAVSLSNTGNTPVIISGVSVAMGAGSYTQTNDCGTLAIGATCSVQVTFKPTARGAVAGEVSYSFAGQAQKIALTGKGIQGAPSLNASSIDFGDVKRGKPAAARMVTVTNSGDSPLVISSATVPTSDFTASTACATLAANASCTVSVGFTPSARGLRSQTLTLATNAGSMTVALQGTGIEGLASVSPGNLLFAAQQASTTSAAQVVTVTNSGTAPLGFTGVSLVAGGSDFAQTNNCATVAVNSSCTVSVAFTPTASGSRAGTLALVEDTGNTSTVALTGTGQAASATLSTPSFAATAVGASATASATLANTGIGPLSVVVPTAGSVSGTDFSFVSTTCAATLAAGTNCSTTVRFSPSSTAARSGTLSIGTGAGTQSVALGSTGIQGYATVTPASLGFSTQQVGSSSAVQVVTVTNTGTNTLSFTGVGISSGSSDFGQTNNCGSVAVNGTCSVNVSFTPAAAGSRTGVLSFTHNGGGIATVNLVGTGQAASATLSTPSFAATAVGGNTSATATLTNTGIGALSVGTPAVSGSDFSVSATTCSTTLAASASCTVTVRFAPTAIGTRSGTLSVLTGAGSQSATLTASGTVGNLSVSATSLNYGTTVKSQTVTLTNTGSSALTLSSVAITAGTSDFSRSTSCSVLAVNGSCTVTVNFTAAAAGARTGTLSFAHNGTGATSVALAGTGFSQATLTSGAGSQASWYGEAAKGSSFTYRNDGNVAMTLGNPSVSAPLSVNSNNCQGIGPGGSCTIGIVLTSTAAGAGGSATQSFVPAGATVSPASASMTWAIYSAVPRWGTTYLNLGSVTVGQTSAANITLYNDGSVAYNWAANSSVANLPAGFTIDTSACSNVAPWGGACNAVVRFTPGWAGGFGGGSVHMAAASFLNNTVQLAGTGVAAPVRLNAGMFQVSAVYQMNSDDAMVYVTNNSGQHLTVSSIQFDGSYDEYVYAIVNGVQYGYTDNSYDWYGRFYGNALWGAGTNARVFYDMQYGYTSMTVFFTDGQSVALYIPLASW